MSLVSSQPPPTNSSFSSIENTDPTNINIPDDTEAALSTLLGAFTNSQPNFMDRGATAFSQSGLHSPYSTAFNNAQSEASSADHASAAHFPQPEARSNNYSTSATPTPEHGIYPASARSGSFPEHIQRSYHPASNHSGSSGGMAQPTSPSMSLQDGRSNHQNAQIKSDQDVPIDPSIAASSPTYPSHGGQYSPYGAQQDMSQHQYSQHGGQMYNQPRPDWGSYAGHPQPPAAMGHYPVTGAQTPTSAAPTGARPGQVSHPRISHAPPPLGPPGHPPAHGPPAGYTYPHHVSLDAPLRGEAALFPTPFFFARLLNR
jgi:hypothetical protein